MQLHSGPHKLTGWVGAESTTDQPQHSFTLNACEHPVERHHFRPPASRSQSVRRRAADKVRTHTGSHCHVIEINALSPWNWRSADPLGGGGGGQFRGKLKDPSPRKTDGLEGKLRVGFPLWAKFVFKMLISKSCRVYGFNPTPPRRFLLQESQGGGGVAFRPSGIFLFDLADSSHFCHCYKIISTRSGVNMKEKPLANPPQQAPEVREVKWSRKLPPKGHFSKSSNFAKMYSDNVKTFEEVWKRQK